MLNFTKVALKTIPFTVRCKMFLYSGELKFTSDKMKQLLVPCKVQMRPRTCIAVLQVLTKPCLLVEMMTEFIHVLYKQHWQATLQPGKNWSAKSSWSFFRRRKMDLKGFLIRYTDSDLFCGHVQVLLSIVWVQSQCQVGGSGD